MKHSIYHSQPPHLRSRGWANVSGSLSQGVVIPSALAVAARLVGGGVGTADKIVPTPDAGVYMREIVRLDDWKTTDSVAGVAKL